MTSLAECPHDRNQTTPQDKAKALRQQIDDRLDTLARAVDDVRASEMFQRYLEVQARFHRYSWHNTMLIASQFPTASNVAGFQTWKKLGRFVRKGEHGIAIFAPCPWKRTEVDATGKEEDKACPECSRRACPERSRRACPERSRREGIYFKVAHVFDVSQTDGQALPKLDIPDVEAVADALLANLERVAVKRGIRVNYVEMQAGHFGVSKGGAIDLATGHPSGQQAKTLAHELAHEALHRKDRPAGLTRNAAELEAESVAYVVCRHCGLDAEIRASRYIALWGGDAQALRASLERIAETARAIIDDVEAQTAERAVA